MDNTFTFKYDYNGKSGEILSISLGKDIKNMFFGGNKTEEKICLENDTKYSLKEIRDTLSAKGIEKLSDLIGGYSDPNHAGELDMDKFLSLLNRGILTKSKEKNTENIEVVNEIPGGSREVLDRRHRRRRMRENEDDFDLDRYTESRIENLENNFSK